MGAIPCSGSSDSSLAVDFFSSCPSAPSRQDFCCCTGIGETMATLGLGGRSPRRFCRGKLPFLEGGPAGRRLAEGISAVACRGVAVATGATGPASRSNLGTWNKLNFLSLFLCQRLWEQFHKALKMRNFSKPIFNHPKWPPLLWIGTRSNHFGSGI